MISKKAKQRAKYLKYADEHGVAAACKEFGIGRTQTFEWLSRRKTQGDAGLEDKVRQPGHHPQATTAIEIERLRELQLEFPKASSEILSRRLLKKGFTRSAVTIRKHKMTPREVSLELQGRYRSGTELTDDQTEFVLQDNPRFKVAPKAGSAPGEKIYVTAIKVGGAKAKSEQRYAHLFFDTYSGFVFGRLSTANTTEGVLVSLKATGRDAMAPDGSLVWAKQPDGLSKEGLKGRIDVDEEFKEYLVHFSNWARSRRKADLKSLSHANLEKANASLRTIMEAYNKIKWKGFPNFEKSPGRLFRRSDNELGSKPIGL